MSEKLSGVAYPTAMVQLKCKQQEMTARIIIDWCSSANYISARIANLLKTDKRPAYVECQGINDLVSDPITVQTNIDLVINEDDKLEVSAFVIDKILESTPKMLKPTACFNNIKLADPEFFNDGSIDALVGAEVAYKLLLPEQQKRDNFFLQASRVGFLVMGGEYIENGILSACITTHEEIKLLAKLFDTPIFEPDSGKKWEDEQAEQIFVDTVTRLPDGRYRVCYPLKPDAPPLGRSFSKALKVFQSQERRLLKNPTLHEESTRQMMEYIELGHLEEVPEEEMGNENSHYLQYLAIINDERVTSALRNVFHCSAQSDSTNVRLNYLFFAGEKLQNDLAQLITKFRLHQYVFVGDISKMFRQIDIEPKMRDYCRVFFRSDPSKKITVYRMTRLIFGHVSSPWLSGRVLHKLADDVAPNEEIRNVIKNQTYVDDTLGGSHTIEGCRQQLNDTVDTFNQGGFFFTKIVANHDEITRDTPAERLMSSYVKGKEYHNKILGLSFDDTLEAVEYRFPVPTKQRLTNSNMLGEMMKLFDPCGFFLPVVVKFRLLFQEIYLLGPLDWKAHVPLNIEEEFRTYMEQLPELNNLKMPRWMHTVDGDEIDLIGVSDASTLALSCSLYIRVNRDGKTWVHLMVAKAKVIAVKERRAMIARTTTATIPKCELEAVRMLTTLYEAYAPLFPKHNFYVFTDSEVVVAWIRKTHVNQTKVIERRIKDIRKVIDPAYVNYINTKENPADYSSRGMTPVEFAAAYTKWIEGPELFKGELPLVPLPRPETCLLTTFNQHLMQNRNVNRRPAPPGEENPILLYLSRYNNYHKIVRLVAKINKAVQLLKPRLFGGEGPITTGRPLTLADIDRAENTLLRMVQKEKYPQEIEELENRRTRPARAWTTNLNVFIDPNGVMRIGGRIHNAFQLKFERRHPIVFPRSHFLRALIFTVHEDNGHCHNNVLEGVIQDKFWVTNLIKDVRAVIRACYLCRRMKMETHKQILSDLPQQRLSFAKPFMYVSCDFAGPFEIRYYEHAKKTTLQKTWVVVFSCVSTLMCHIELVESYDTAGFLAAFRRYTARRGMCVEMMSDNGPQLLRAKRVFDEMEWYEHFDEIKETLQKMHVRWVTIPARTPHQGANHEKVVKLLKHYIHRIPDLTKLTARTFTDILIQAEGMINSRPICRITKDTGKYNVICPSHFLIQRPITMLPPLPRAILDLKKPMGKRFQQVNEEIDEIHDVVLNSYFRELNSRYYWNTPQPNIMLNDLVVLHDYRKGKKRAHVARWPIAEVVKVYSDKYGSVRAARVRRRIPPADELPSELSVPYHFVEFDRAIGTFTRIPRDEDSEGLRTFPSLNPYYDEQAWRDTWHNRTEQANIDCEEGEPSVLEQAIRNASGGSTMQNTNIMGGSEVVTTSERYPNSSDQTSSAPMTFSLNVPIYNLHSENDFCQSHLCRHRLSPQETSFKYKGVNF